MTDIKIQQYRVIRRRLQIHQRNLIADIHRISQVSSHSWYLINMISTHTEIQWKKKYPNILEFQWILSCSYLIHYNSGKWIHAGYFNSKPNWCNISFLNLLTTWCFNFIHNWKNITILIISRYEELVKNVSKIKCSWIQLKQSKTI